MKHYKILLFLGLAFTLTYAFLGCALKETPAEDFSYDIIDGEISITGYNGTEREIRIPKKIADRPVTKIGSEAFSGYDLVSIKFPNTLTIIGNNAFEYCSCLESIEIPKTVEKIGEKAFYHCSALEKVSIPDTITKIPERCFSSCKSLIKIDIPASVTTICNAAFEYCEKLETANLPDNDELYLEDDCFKECTNLKKLYLPRNARMEMGYESQSSYNPTLGSYVSVTFVSTPIDYYINSSFNSNVFNQNHEDDTVIVVKKDSTAHEQLKKYSSYDIKYEVED